MTNGAVDIGGRRLRRASSALCGRISFLFRPPGCNDPPPATFMATNIVTEVVMFRKTMIALTTVADLGGGCPRAACPIRVSQADHMRRKPDVRFPHSH